MIVGTAGHIDHGKTTLVKALTGVDTDRLPEEKQRGISIALGYAYLEVGAGSSAVAGVAEGVAEAGAASGSSSTAVRIGFVDVPGHERLVHTMLSGATGIDHALLLVAADDGVMPQTREHLALLSLLGIARGTIALTKCDRVDAAMRAQRREEIRALVTGTPLAEAPIFQVAATAGEGVRELREHLVEEARQLPAREVEGWGFRLAVDRVFSLAGVGTVCTGTAHAGAVAIGDELVLLPPAPGQAPRRGRVRSLHAQNAAVERATAGQRVAIGLVGIDKDEVARGQWLAAPEIAQWTDRLDARLRLWAEETRPLRSGTSVHVHVGAEQVTGSVAVLGSVDGGALDAVAPGSEAFVQLVLHRPVGAWAGDRVVLRDASATRALAGGVVLDPQGPARYRRTEQRLGELVALAAPTVGQRLSGLLLRAPMGVDLARFAAGQGVATKARAGLIRAEDPLPSPLPHGGRGGQSAPSASKDISPSADNEPSADREPSDPLSRLRERAGERVFGLEDHEPSDSLSRLRERAGERVFGLEDHEPSDSLSRLRERAGERVFELPAHEPLVGAVVPGADGPSWALGAAQTALWTDTALQRLERYHQEQPEELGPDLARWRRLAAPRMAEPLWRALVQRMAASGQVAITGAAAHRPEHGVQLSALDERLAQKMTPALMTAGFEGAWARDLAKQTAEPEALVRTTLARLAQRGELFQVVKDLYYAPPAIRDLARIARESAIGGDVTAASFRDRSGLGRKRAIQVLEFFDKVGLLRRVGDAHRLRTDCRLFIDEDAPGGVAHASHAA
ncbi:selenocysteine-specific translation elongation factor [Roseateles sp.]|uniref:selenocysteine-specific translation elongation factor n=1 Tax=Roseateles sp. TaxID=1971397 RepID=UPI0031D986DE